MCGVSIPRIVPCLSGEYFFIGPNYKFFILKEVDGVFAFRVFHKEWPSSIDLAKPIDEQTWDEQTWEEIINLEFFF